MPLITRLLRNPFNNNANQSLTIASFYGISTLLTCALFSDPITHIHLALLFYAYLALLIDEKEVKFDNRLPSITMIRLSMIIALTVFSLMALFSWKQYNEVYKITEDITDPTNRKFSEMTLSVNENYIMTRSGQLLASGQIDEAIKFLESVKNKFAHWKVFLDLGMAYWLNRAYKKAEDNLIITSNMIPHLVYPKFLLAKVYLESGDLSKFKLIVRPNAPVGSKYSEHHYSAVRTVP